MLYRLIMNFREPWMLALLLILPILGSLLTRAQRKQIEAAEKLRGKRTLSAAKLKRRIAFRLAAFAALILALAQPVWNPRPGPGGQQGRDLVIALDISRSMLAADVFPSRLDAAKIALFESLDHMRGQRIGLITFAGAASVRVPLTLDHSFVRYMLERAAPSDADVGSTSIQSAIEKAVDIVLKESEQGQQDLIILTDGEDYLSNIETTAGELRECGARVLIIGIGDPVAGAKIPDIEKTNTWMQYKGADVVTRLDEDKLVALAAESPNVTYIPAHTRPFDLLSLYRTMETDPRRQDDLNGQTIYTEGFPWLIALALILWLFPKNKRLLPMLTAVMLAGCSPEFHSVEKDFAQHMETGRTLWSDAQVPLETDPRAALSALTAAREEFLRAALIHPGNPESAQQIAGISAQIRTVQLAIDRQEKTEAELQQKLRAAIKILEELTRQEAALSDQSRNLLKKQPPSSPEDQAATAPSVREEQTRIASETAGVQAVVEEIQSFLRLILSAPYEKRDTPPPTEFDEAVITLTAARTEQQSAIENLNPEDLRWPQANSALFTATRRMQEALGLLNNQTNGSGADPEEQEGDPSEWDDDEMLDWEDSSQDGAQSMPMTSQSFQTALDSRSLPVPNYTAEEILKEEADNMQQRARQKSERAGAQVEKNW